MKITIPHFETKEALFGYLRKNAAKIIAQKKALPTISDDLWFGYSTINGPMPFKAKAIKDDNAGTDQVNENTDELQVEIIANVSGWCDSQMDVMIKDNWNKSISDVGASGQKLIYHLKNHCYSTDSIIGKDPSVFTKEIDLSIFNFESDIKKAQALLMSSTVCKSYCEKTFLLYKDKQVKQHSIGLQYVKLYLCINSEDPEDIQYKENWDKYYPQVINKDKVDKYGYFWAVTECKILEVSAVLYGSNELTPDTSNIQTDNTETDPSKSNQHQPLQHQPLNNAEEKSIAICPNCSSFFNATSSNSNCPSCGQYVSGFTQQIEEDVDWGAIAATI